MISWSDLASVSGAIALTLLGSAASNVLVVLLPTPLYWAVGIIGSIALMFFCLSEIK